MRWWKRNGRHIPPTDLDRKIEQEETRAQIVADRTRITCAAYKILVQGTVKVLQTQVEQK